MTRLVLSVAALMAATTASASAQQWTHLGSAGSEWEIYFNPHDLTRSAEHEARLRFWIKREAASGGPHAGPDANYYVSQAEIDCDAGTARVLFTVTYRPDGSAAARDDDPTAAEPIPPGTFYDLVRQRIC